MSLIVVVGYIYSRFKAAKKKNVKWRNTNANWHNTNSPPLSILWRMSEGRIFVFAIHVRGR